MNEVTKLVDHPESPKYILWLCASCKTYQKVLNNFGWSYKACGPSSVSDFAQVVKHCKMFGMILNEVTKLVDFVEFSKYILESTKIFSDFVKHSKRFRIIVNEVRNLVDFFKFSKYTFWLCASYKGLLNFFQLS